MADYNYFKALNHDIIVNIMSRLDGQSLSALSSACKDLYEAAQDIWLWKKLCNETWPSTSMIKIASPDFKSLYASAFPLILYDSSSKLASGIEHSSSSPSDFTSLVDIYYKGHTLFSKVMDSLGESTFAFLSYPFEFDLLDTDYLERITKLPTSALTICNEREIKFDKIIEELRMSWIVLNTKNKSAVNISSWKPRWIQKCTVFEEYTLCFGSVIQVEDDNVYEFVIKVKCRFISELGSIRWKEMTLVINDIDGTNLSGEDIMMVMDQALNCSHSVNHERVNMGYEIFGKKKVLLLLKYEHEEQLLNIFCASIAIATLLIICYTCSILL